MTIYRDVMGLIGVGCLAFGISGNVYWSLVLVGFTMLCIVLHGPRWASNNQVKTFTFDYAELMYLLQNPGQSFNVNGVRIYFDSKTLSQLKLGLSDNGGN